VTGQFNGAQQGAGTLTINVKSDGYHPTVTRAKANEAYKLAFVSKDTYSCARALVVPALRLEKLLPETGTVLIDLPPQPAGSKLFFSCSMGMYSGVIVFDG
jgi:plastocyanin domain-containing protein